MPVVSVIMPNFGGGKYIGRALDSVLAQTISDIEVIVSDDASTDDSVARVVEKQRTDPRIRLIASQNNGGPAHSRNLALAEARGRWIALVDSDDMIHPERLARLLAAAERAAVDIIADDLLYFHEDGTPPRLLLPDRQQTLDIRAVDWILAGDNGLPPLGYLKPLIRAQALSELRYDETLRIGEDYDLVLRLLLKGATMQVIPEPWYFYRRHGQSLSHRHSAADLEAMIASQLRLTRASGPFDPAVDIALHKRLAKLRSELDFERLVAAIKSRHYLEAASEIARHPGSILRLGRSAREHFRRNPSPDLRSFPALVVLCEDGSDPSAEERDDAVLIRVPSYPHPEQQEFGGTGRRRAWRELADLGWHGRTTVLTSGKGGAYAAGFIPRIDDPAMGAP